MFLLLIIINFTDAVCVQYGYGNSMLHTPPLSSACGNTTSGVVSNPVCIQTKLKNDQKVDNFD